jgi:alkanesulfonate monooxygenase SsuD/methylene tetrahydromethanopterin reductase-like flavin-dependent oxidoreductase (luciferase family)
VSLDVLSGGRLTLGVGAGYLESEFRALGVDFGERNDLLDEALVAMRRAWAEDGVHIRGRHFDVHGHTMLPRPVQAPHPPIWVGGNSKRAIRRAVDLADGWTPMPNPRALGARRRSAHLETLDELRALLAYADGYRAAGGHTGAFEVSVMPMSVPGPGTTGYDPARFRDHVAELAAIRIDGVVLMIPAGSRAQLVDRITEFGASTIEPASPEHR